MALSLAVMNSNVLQVSEMAREDVQAIAALMDPTGAVFEGRFAIQTAARVAQEGGQAAMNPSTLPECSLARLPHIVPEMLSLAVIFRADGSPPWNSNDAARSLTTAWYSFWPRISKRNKGSHVRRRELARGRNANSSLPGQQAPIGTQFAYLARRPLSTRHISR